MLFPVLFKKKKKVLFNTFRHFNVLLFSLIIAVLFLSHRDLKLACIFILCYCLTDHLPHPIGCPYLKNEEDHLLPLPNPHLNSSENSPE